MRPPASAGRPGASHDEHTRTPEGKRHETRLNHCISARQRHHTFMTASRAETARFNRQTKFSGDEGCLLWTGQTGRGGYGRFRRDDGSTIAAHRFVWQFVMGREIPDGMQVDHMCHGWAVEAGTCAGDSTDRGCRHRACCNPQHLELVSAAENTRRQDHAERKVTHCPQGHEYTEENTRITRDGKRKCRSCHRTRW